MNRITLDDLEDYGLGSNLKGHMAKLKPHHWQYAASLLAEMREDTEAEMNKAWARLPRAIKPKPDDKLARIITELISRMITRRYA